jgi:hypothetical protein
MGGIHNQRADGGCVLDGSWNRCIAADRKPWRAGGTLLLPVPLYFRQGIRGVQHRQFSGTEKKESACSEAGINDSGSGDLVNDAG